MLPPLLRLAVMIAPLASCSAFDQFAEAKEIAARDMKDPTSVQFRNVSRCEGRNVVRGERNGKNSFGAYEGFDQFWVYKGQVYTIANSPSEFETVIAACAGKSIEEFREIVRKGAA